MDNIYSLEEAKAKKEDPPEYVYNCSDCSCGIFWCFADGRIQCANCGTLAESIKVIEDLDGSL